MCVFYTVRGHHFVASRVSSQTPAQLKPSGRESLHYRYTRTRGVAAEPSAPLVGPDPNMPSSVYRWSIFSIKLQTQKERHGVGERRANPETTLPSRPPGPLAAAGLPGGTPAGARLFYALFGVDNPPGPIYSGLVPKGSRRLSPPRRHTRPMKVTCARMSSTAQRFAPGRGLSCLGIFSPVQSRV